MRGIDTPVALRGLLLALLLLATAAVVVATRPAGAGNSSPTPLVPSPTPSTATMIGAGDIVECEAQDDESTAALVDGVAGIVFTLGDNVYPDATAKEFADCYGPSWGRFKDRTRPVAGNHEYHTAGADPYFDYFGAVAGEPGKGWYSYQAGSWHVVALNSNCDEIGGCDADSPQVRWLRDDLAANAGRCTLALWHHSRFSSGRYGDDRTYQPFWDALYAAGAEVVLTAHDHQYERFKPQTPEGSVDPAAGIRGFIVGTGGGSLREFEATSANSELRLNERFGVIKLVLDPDRYSWEFITAPDGRVDDRGSDVCH